ncbi:MAG: flagellar export protein FliJ [Woeseiaceae bacterium]
MANVTDRSKKIGKIASLAAAEERRFGEMAGRARRHLQEQLDRLGELNAFRHNYEQKAAGQATLRAAHWQDYQSFLHRLDTAVKAQQQIVRDSERALEVHRQRWIAKRQRLESLQKVLEKYRANERVQESRREQKTLDELASKQPAFPEDQ